MSKKPKKRKHRRPSKQARRAKAEPPAFRQVQSLEELDRLSRGRTVPNVLYVYDEVSKKAAVSTTSPTFRDPSKTYESIFRYLFPIKGIDQ